MSPAWSAQVGTTAGAGPGGDALVLTGPTVRRGDRRRARIDAQGAAGSYSDLVMPARRRTAGGTPTARQAE